MSDPTDLVVIYKTANATEAYLVKNLLQDEGIAATVGEEHEFLSLPITPSDVLVRRSDEAHAREIVSAYDADQQRRADRPDWVCPACGATVVGAFDECDACGADRPGSEEE
ncbi:MAG TPA: DUF2007 domain-containing protein [Pirellulales bacterium]|nr:DUF2007 domain-containing protein [Pirellulales bacterium]